VLEVAVPAGRDDLVRADRPSWVPHDTVIRLEQGQVVAGSVCDTSGHLVPGAVVLWASATSGWASSVRTDQDGRFRIGGVRRGERLRLRALPGPAENLDPRIERDTVEAVAGDTYVQLELDLRLHIVVRVEGIPAGVPPQWLLTITRTDGASSSVSSSGGRVPASGVIRLTGVDVSRSHRLFVGPTADGFCALSDVLAPGQDVVLRMERGEPLAGRVVLPAGVAATEVEITASGDGWFARATADGQGRFRFPGLPPGDVWVGAYVLRDGKVRWQQHAAATSRTDVVLTLEPAPAER